MSCGESKRFGPRCITIVIIIIHYYHIYIPQPFARGRHSGAVYNEHMYNSNWTGIYAEFHDCTGEPDAAKAAAAAKTALSIMCCLTLTRMKQTPKKYRTCRKLENYVQVAIEHCYCMIRFSEIFSGAT